MLDHGGHGLVLGRPQTALTYIKGAVINPVSLSILSFAVCVGIGYAGVIGSLVATVVFLTFGILATRWRWVRNELDRQLLLRQQQKREADRLRKLRPAGPARQHQYCELRDLIGEIERTDPEESARFELQQLLDQFVTLALGHQRYLESLRFGAMQDLGALDPKRSTRRREIMVRRQRHRDLCVVRIEQIADDLDAVDELVRLIAQRVAAPNIDSDLDRELERRLWELDEVDAALAQLSA